MTFNNLRVSRVALTDLRCASPELDTPFPTTRATAGQHLSRVEASAPSLQRRSEADHPSIRAPFEASVLGRRRGGFENGGAALSASTALLCDDAFSRSVEPSDDKPKRAQDLTGMPRRPVRTTTGRPCRLATKALRVPVLVGCSPTSTTQT